MRFHPKEDTLFSASYDDSIKVQDSPKLLQRERKYHQIHIKVVFKILWFSAVPALNVDFCVGGGVAGMGGG